MTSNNLWPEFSDNRHNVMCCCPKCKGKKKATAIYKQSEGYWGQCSRYTPVDNRVR